MPRLRLGLSVVSFILVLALYLTGGWDFIRILSLNIKINTLSQLGKYEEQIPYAKQYGELSERRLGVDHHLARAAVGLLASTNRNLGRNREALIGYQDLLAREKRAFGAESATVASTYGTISMVQGELGQVDQQIESLKSSLQILETLRDPNPTDVQFALLSLALISSNKGRHAEFLQFASRADEVVRGATISPADRAFALLGQATDLAARSQNQKAFALGKEAMTLFIRAWGASNTKLVAPKRLLSGLYSEIGEHNEAEILAREALDLQVTATGTNHLLTGEVMEDLAAILTRRGNHVEALDHRNRVRVIMESSLPPTHRKIWRAHQNLSGSFAALGQWEKSLDHAYAAADTIVAGRSASGVARRDQSQIGFPQRHAFSQVLDTAALVSEQDTDKVAVHFARTFETAQWALHTTAGAALGQMAVRFTTSSADLIAFIRERQDLQNEWQQRDAQLLSALSLPKDRRNTQEERKIRIQLEQTERSLARTDSRLSAEFPNYSALADPGALSVADVQRLLRADEALIMFSFTPLLHRWVVTKEGASLTPSRVNPTTSVSDIRGKIEALRCGLDDALWNKSDSSERCVGILKKHRYDDNIDGQFVKVLPFDLDRAHDLYKSLLGPVDDLIQGKKHLLVVLSGPLTSLPLHVLVTEPPPKTGIPRALVGYRDVAWLALRHAITVLPSVASLKSLREFAKVSRAGKAYFGIGNPLLDGPQDDPEWGSHYKDQARVAIDKRCSDRPERLRVATAVRVGRSVGGFEKLFRGARIDIEDIRRQTPLPETADELCEIGRQLGAPVSDILLGHSATETNLKALSTNGLLANYVIVHFATHGTLTGQVKGSAEPGLILTPPTEATTDTKLLDLDDGYLMASEVATLKLDADWVILSGCYTAGGSGEDAEALSGLARAFFYAGARALLVSHWDVGSEVAVKLTVGAFDKLKAHPHMARAEAFRLSMGELIVRGTDFEAHPSQWGPFVVVGEGAAAR